MALYMDQELFNAIVFTCAWAGNLRSTNEEATDSLIEDMLANYRKTYPKDDFEPEVGEAVDRLMKWLDSPQFSDEEKPFWLNAFRIAVGAWKPDGTRKRRGFLKSAWITSPRKKPSDRVENFTRDFVLYFLNIHSGKIDLRML